MNLLFSFNGIDHEIALRHDLAPKTIDKLLASLPSRLDIHCAKIAGQHIFWHAPFVAQLESSIDIMTLPAGTFLYWPERQFLELIYGELQAEKASVSVLGQLVGDIQWLKEMGRNLVLNHGREVTWAALDFAPGSDYVPQPQPAIGHAGLQALVEARESAWAVEPSDVKRLLARRGMMLPFGPLVMAEGELRKCHELLWRLWNGSSGLPAEQLPQVASFLLQAFIDRVDGFCGMHETGDVLKQIMALLNAAEVPARMVLEEAVLYTGRMAAWLDLYICWNDCNEHTLTLR
jgi:hypothetical protein